MKKPARKKTAAATPDPVPPLDQIRNDLCRWYGVAAGLVNTLLGQVDDVHDALNRPGSVLSKIINPRAIERLRAALVEADALMIDCSPLALAIPDPLASLPQPVKETRP